MATKWEIFQERIKAKMREVYPEAYIEHAMNPKNTGEIENADSYVSVTGTCGDRLKLWLKIKDNRIIQASFLTDGCAATMACGSIATELVKGKTPDEALAISAEVISSSLGGIPDDHAHCAELASLTLKKAVAEYMNPSQKP